MLNSYPFEPREVQYSQPTQLEAAPGFKFIIVKFIAFLTCIISWIADEQWRIEALADNRKDFYTLLTSKVSETYTVSSNGNLRDIVENVDLGLCFGDLSRFDLIKQGIDTRTPSELVRAWKKANPAISGFINDSGLFAASGSLDDWWEHSRSLYGKNENDYCVQLYSTNGILYRATESDVDDLNHPYRIYHRFKSNGNTYRACSGGELLKVMAIDIAKDLINEFMWTAYQCNGYRFISNRFNQIVLEVPACVSSEHVVTSLLDGFPVWMHGMPLRVEASECTVTPGNDSANVWKRSTILGSNIFMASDYTLTPGNHQQSYPEE